MRYQAAPSRADDARMSKSWFGRLLLIACAAASTALALTGPAQAWFRPAVEPVAATSAAADLGNVSATLAPVVYGPVDGLPDELVRGRTYDVSFLVLLTSDQKSEMLQISLTGGELRHCEKRRLKPGVVNRVVCKFLAGRARTPLEQRLTFSLRVGIKGTPYTTTYRHTVGAARR